jgi:hypothetical protein
MLIAENPDGLGLDSRLESLSAVRALIRAQRLPVAATECAPLAMSRVGWG